MKKQNIILLIAVVGIAYLFLRGTKKGGLVLNTSGGSNTSGDPYTMSVDEKKTSLFQYVDNNYNSEPMVMEKLRSAVMSMNDEELTIVYIYVMDYYSKNIILDQSNPIYSKFVSINDKYRIF
jgi:hypothetical protein